jgi:hypothetical protein
MYPDVQGQVRQLPPYRALLIVDVKEFSSRPGRYHQELTAAIPRILRQAFARCGLADLFEEALFQGTTGDGYFLGFRPAVLPYLINPFLAALQDELDYRATVKSVSGPEQDLRMRVSVNVGPMADSGRNAINDGSGDARIENHRLLDSAPVRDLLAKSGPVTRVAAIISARAFEDAVASGYAAESADLFVRVPVTVKNYQGQAYLRVPKPSGDLLTNGFQPTTEVEDDVRAKPAERRGGSVTNVVGSVSGGSVVQAERVGNIKIGGGNIGHVAGSVVQSPSGPVHTGSGNQYNSPMPHDQRSVADD